MMSCSERQVLALEELVGRAYSDTPKPPRPLSFQDRTVREELPGPVLAQVMAQAVSKGARLLSRYYQPTVSTTTRQARGGRQACGAE